MSTINKEQLREDLKASTQNSSGMFEIGEETICALMSLLWGGGKVLPGLVTRAGKEKALCLEGVK